VCRPVAKEWLGYVGCAIRAADFPNDLAPVVNGEGEIGACTSEVLKHEGSVVFPHYGVRRRVPSSLRPRLDR
jgi:hypothetical protein